MRAGNLNGRQRSNGILVGNAWCLSRCCAPLQRGRQWVIGDHYCKDWLRAAPMETLLRRWSPSLGKHIAGGSGLLWILGLLCDGLLSSQLPHTYLASVIVSFSSVPILLLPVSHLESALKSPITILSFLFSICITPFCLFVLIHPTSCVPCSLFRVGVSNTQFEKICPRNTCLFCDLFLLVFTCVPSILLLSLFFSMSFLTL